MTMSERSRKFFDDLWTSIRIFAPGSAPQPSVVHIADMGMLRYVRDGAQTTVTETVNDTMDLLWNADRTEIVGVQIHGVSEIKTIKGP